MERKQMTALISLLAIISIFTFAAAASFAGHNVYTQNSVNTVNTDTPSVSADAQVVQMTMQNGNYQLSPARVKVNVPVKIIGDMSTIRGCYTTVVIPDLSVRKTLTATDNVIEFTPTKAGTFRMTCGMNMAGGQIIVEDANGNAPAATTPTTTQSSGGSCGAGGGGCGCGSKV